MNLFRRTPWKSRLSIYNYIKNNIDENGIFKGDMDLPDEEIINSNSKIKFSPGAFDGAFGHHTTSSEGEDKLAQELAILLGEISKYSNKRFRIDFYNKIVEGNMLSRIDNLIEEAGKRNVRVTPRLKEWFEFLAFNSPDREAVKVGIALLGATGAKDKLHSIVDLGKHEEFTLYATIAVMNLSDNYERDLWSLAKSVHGWGRIQIVERLADTENPEIKEWILLEGYKNSIMFEYLALIAAETGNLADELLKPNPSTELILAASDLISALISEGPCAGISAYDKTTTVFERYVDLLKDNHSEISHLITNLDIYDYVNDENRDWDKLISNGWNAEIRSSISEKAKQIIDDEFWISYIEDNVDTEDKVFFWKLNQGAKRLKVDLSDVHWNRLNKDPLDAGLWFDLMESVDDNSIDTICDFALQKLPFKEKCTGPDSLMGLGKDFKVYNSFAIIMQGLKKFPGKGQEIIRYAMDSPVINNRNAYLNIFDAWGYENIDPSLIDKLKQQIDIEPEEKVRDRMLAFLEGIS